MPKGKPGSGKKASAPVEKTPLKSVVEILSETNSSPVLMASLLEEGSSEVIVHNQAVLLEFNTPQLLEEVMRTTLLARFVVRQVGEQALMVDHSSQDELVKLLTKKGYEPRVS